MEKKIFMIKNFLKKFFSFNNNKKTSKKPRKIEVNLNKELKSLIAIESSVALQLIAFKLSNLIDAKKNHVKQNFNKKNY